jgi:capsid protein
MPLIDRISGFFGRSRAKAANATDPATQRGGFIQYSGYDATKPKGKRQSPTGLVRDEDKELPPSARRMAVSGMRDLVRNFSVVQWAVRKHLDFVSSFRFKATTGIPELDARLEDLVEYASRKENYDVAGRHPLSRAIRMAEARTTVDGDIFCLKLSDGHVQWIEGDRIRTPYSGTPPNIDPKRVNHGVITDPAGKALAYILCKRAITSDQGYLGGDMQYDRTLRAAWVYHHACWDLCRFDQVRGNSPLLSAYNNFRDVYESVDYAQAKAKVAQLFALAVYREANPEGDTLGQTSEIEDHNGVDPKVAANGGTDANGAGRVVEPEPRYSVDFGRGPVLLDLDDGDRAEVLESDTPSTEFQSFLPLILQLALKAIDVPFSFYDEAYTNYSGQKQAFILYEKSAETKRQNNRDLLNDWTRWRLNIFVDEGDLNLAKYGLQMKDVKFEWRHTGTPWLDQLKEVVGTIAAIEAGMESPITAIEESTGRDWEEVLQDRKRYLDKFAELGMDPPTWSTNPKEALQADAPSSNNEQQNDTTGKQQPVKEEKPANKGKRKSAAYDLAMSMAVADRAEPLPKKEPANA